MNPIDQHSEEIDLALRTLPGTSAQARIFDAPWQARVFALIVALVKRGHLPWKTFHAKFLEEMSGDALAGGQSSSLVERQYFECWLAAAEATLKDVGYLDHHDLGYMIAELRLSTQRIRDMQTKNGLANG